MRLRQFFDNVVGAIHGRAVGQPHKTSRGHWPRHHRECDGKYFVPDTIKVKTAYYSEIVLSPGLIFIELTQNLIQVAEVQLHE